MEKADLILEILRQHTKQFDRLEHRIDRMEEKLDAVYESRDKVTVKFGWQWGLVSLMIAVLAVGVNQLVF